MDYAIVHRSEPLDSLPVRHIGIGRQTHDAYVLVENEVQRWQVAINWGDSSSLPFREQVIWRSTNVVIIGGGADVFFLDLQTGEPRLQVPLRGYFGHLALHDAAGADQELLLILGCSEVIAIGPSFRSPTLAA